ncbi:MAG: hypothetical protein ABDI19_08185 [Armatimonadota bacterium]
MKTLPRSRAEVANQNARAEPLPHKPKRSASPTPRAADTTSRPPKRWLTGAALPTSLCLLFISLHLTLIALLNWESARRAWLEKEAQRLQQQNEALRARLNALSAEPWVRHWAEAHGMVRAETRSAQIIQIRKAANGRWQVASGK